MTSGEVEIGVVMGGAGLENNVWPMTGGFEDAFLRQVVPKTRPQVVTVLPTDPGAGAEVYFAADAANGVYWHLAYIPDGTQFPWRYVGGPPMRSQVATPEGIGAVFPVYNRLATTGPGVTLPLTGVYEFGYGCSTYNTAVASNVMGAFVGSTAKMQVNGAEMAFGPVNAASSMSDWNDGTFSAGDFLEGKYACTAGIGTFRARWLWARPVKVGV